MSGDGDGEGGEGAVRVRRVVVHHEAGHARRRCADSLYKGHLVRVRVRVRVRGQGLGVRVGVGTTITSSWDYYY